MRPVNALVGRSNVGKSTLFNRLTRSRSAIVANLPGLTRDRQYGEGSIDGKSFIAIDTGGINIGDEGINQEMASQSLQAIAEATVCLFLVDARDGLTADDNMILDYLRKQNKHGYLVVNKIDGMDENEAVAEFYALGIANIFPITATQGSGVKTMLTTILDEFDDSDEDAYPKREREGIKENAL